MKKRYIISFIVFVIAIVILIPMSLTSCVEAEFLPYVSSVEIKGINVENDPADHLTVKLTPLYNLKAADKSSQLYFKWYFDDGTSYYTTASAPTLKKTFPYPGRWKVTVYAVYADVVHEYSTYVDLNAKKVLAVYMAADNNLSSINVNGLSLPSTLDVDATDAVTFVEDNVAKLLKIAPEMEAQNVMVLFVDNYYLTDKVKYIIIGKNVVKEYEYAEVDSANSSSLSKFLSWVHDSFPANEYSLVIWGHALGAQPATRYAAYDETSNSLMSESGLRDAVLNTLGKVKVLIFDACAMSSAAAFSDLTGAAEKVVASAGLVPGEGLGIQNFALSWLGGNSDTQAIDDFYNGFKYELDHWSNPSAVVTVDLDYWASVEDVFKKACNDILDGVGGATKANFKNELDNDTTEVQYAYFWLATEEGWSFIDMHRILEIAGGKTGMNYLNDMDAIMQNLILKVYKSPLTNSNNYGIYVAFKKNATTETDDLTLWDPSYLNRGFCVYTRWREILEP